MRCSFSQQGTFRLNHGIYTVCCGDLQAVLEVPEGGMSAMRLVMLTGEHTVGEAVGSAMGLTAGLAAARAAVL